MRCTCQERACRLLVCSLLLVGCGRIGFDALETDSQPPIDAAFVAGNGCTTGVDAHTVALYQFNDLGQPMADSVGDHPGMLAGNAQLVASTSNCGMALSVPGESTDYGEIPHDAAWNLDTGSVDFWFRVNALPADFAGVVSRDASGTVLGGHFVVALSFDGRVGVRIQRQGDGNGTGAICSATAVLPGTWAHVGVNFGSPSAELWLNGVNVDAPGSLLGTCQTGHDGGISGNANSWVLGASTRNSPEGAVVTTRPFAGAIDHLRISSIRRDFSTI